MDVNGGFLDQYFYCDTLDVCQVNVWNYLDYDCPNSEWVRSNNLTLTDCGATEGVCPSFYSSPESVGVQTNTTQALASSEYCTIFIDSSQTVSHMIIDNAYKVAIAELRGYLYSHVIIIPEGTQKYYTIYNYNEYGSSVTFTLSFSFAVQRII